MFTAAVKINVQETGACRRKLRVETDSVSVDAEYDRVLSEYAKEAKVPGFRKGMAPPVIVERRYSQDILEETRSRLIPASYRQALADKKIIPIAMIGVSEVSLEKGRGLTFSVG